MAERGDCSPGLAAGARTEDTRSHFDARYEHGSRQLVTSSDALVRYLTRWRIERAWRELRRRAPDITTHSSVLFMCAGDAGEATALADLGVTNIVICDLSENGVRAAVRADPRLGGFVSDALDSGLADGSYDVVVVQDGLHHLREPTKGFTEMLRIARRAAVFLEGHDSLSGRVVGREWELEGSMMNFVFRWNRRLVDQVAKSYLGRDAFENASFSFWHHNVHLAALGNRLGGGAKAGRHVRLLKRIADTVLPRAGNQFCGMVIKQPVR